MTSPTDQQLLREYTESRSESAFAELVRRHIDLVYSAALRMVRDAQLAEDVTQGVFLALAGNAPQLLERLALCGWLHRTAQNIAAQTVRTDVRRRAREQEAAAMNKLLSAESDPVWERIAPQLDAALAELSETDRDAVLLRYFERKSAREMAQALGTSEDAAQRRVGRAVEHLREFFAKQGITVGSSGLLVVISANAVQAAPVGLTATLTAAALAGTTTTATAAAAKAIAMTTLQKTLLAATLAVVAGTGIYEARQTSRLRGQVQTLQQQQASRAEIIDQLSQALKAATNQVAALRDENARLNHNSAELLRLRGEITRLRGDLQELAQSKAASDGKDKTAQEVPAKTWIERVSRLQAFLEQNPKEAIPEIQSAGVTHWLNSIQFQVETEEDLRRALFLLRNQAQSRFSLFIKEAVVKYAQANSGQFPTELSRLQPYCEPGVGNTLVQLYEIVPSSVVKDSESHVTGDSIITRKVKVNPNSPLRLAVFKDGGSQWYRLDARD